MRLLLPDEICLIPSSQLYSKAFWPRLKALSNNFEKKLIENSSILVTKPKSCKSCRLFLGLRMNRGSTWADLMTESKGARDGAVVRALASHQCGPGSNTGVDAIYGLSLLLVLSFAPRAFSPGTQVFPFPQKPTFSNSNTIRNQVDEEPLCGCATS